MIVAPTARTADALMITSLFADRHLITELTRRDLSARYVGSTLGAAWAVLQPLALILIFTVVFSALSRGELAGAAFDARWHYSVYLCAGLLPWIAAAEIVTRAAVQFVEMANLIKKIPFRKAVLIWAVGLANWITFLIAALLFVVFLLLIRAFRLDAMLAWLGLCALFLLLMVGLGAVAACLTVFVRDVRHVAAVGMQLWFWSTPIVWLAGDHMPRWLLRLERANPAWWFIAPMQNVILRREFPPALHWTGLALAAALALWLGGLALRRAEPHMADVL